MAQILAQYLRREDEVSITDKIFPLLAQRHGAFAFAFAWSTRVDGRGFQCTIHKTRFFSNPI